MLHLQQTRMNQFRVRYIAIYNCMSHSIEQKHVKLLLCPKHVFDRWIGARVKHDEHLSRLPAFGVPVWRHLVAVCGQLPPLLPGFPDCPAMEEAPQESTCTERSERKPVKARFQATELVTGVNLFQTKAYNIGRYNIPLAGPQWMMTVRSVSL